MLAEVKTLPTGNLSDVPSRLRALADSIEAGDFADAHNLAWVIDCGNGRLEIGLLGRCAELSSTLYYLLGLGKRKVEDASA